MRLYYRDNFVTLYHGDFRELPAVAPVDVVITDPPYEETGLAWDKWPEGWPEFVRERLAPHGSLWCWGSLRLFMDNRDEFAGYTFAQDAVWEKHNGSSLMNDRFRRVHELCAHFYPKGVKWGKIFKGDIERTVQEETRGKRLARSSVPLHWGDVTTEHVGYEYDGTRLERSVIFERSAHYHAVHPTQKPMGISRKLVAYSCPGGGVGLDIFAGSGTTLLALKELGRRAIGCEADEAHCEAAAKRLEQGQLFHD